IQNQALIREIDQIENRLILMIEQAACFSRAFDSDLNEMMKISKCSICDGDLWIDRDHPPLIFSSCRHIYCFICQEKLNNNNLNDDDNDNKIKNKNNNKDEEGDIKMTNNEKKTQKKQITKIKKLSKKEEKQKEIKDKLFSQILIQFGSKLASLIDWTYKL